MFWKIFFLFFILTVSSCSHSIPIWKQQILTNLTEQEQYFCEIALGSEFGKKYHKIRKWDQPIKVYLAGVETIHLEEELDQIIEELNQLLPSTGIFRVFDSRQANMTIFLGSGQDFAKSFQQAKDKVSKNWGLVFIKQNRHGIIKESNIYIDIFRATNPIAQRHLLREELTQALGLLNDSQQFPDSIFYQEWTLTTAYSSLDKWLIQTLYREDILPSMNFKEVIQQLELTK